MVFLLEESTDENAFSWLHREIVIIVFLFLNCNPILFIRIVAKYNKDSVKNGQ